MPAMTTTDAPAIRGEYPLAGERIGPAWRLMWQRLGEADGFVVGLDWCAGLASETGLDPKTLVNLLRAARQAELIERKFYKIPRPDGTERRMACYRRTDVPRATSTRAAGGR